MAETWVHPVTEGREAPPAWIPKWRFRLVMLIVLAIGVAIVAVIYHYASGAGDQGTGLTRAAGHLAAVVALR